MEKLSNLLARYHKEHKALPSYNFNDVWDLKALANGVILKTNQPLLVMTYKNVVDELGLNTCVAMVKARAKDYDQPLYLHLDHCDDMDRCLKAVDVGYDSVMYDGSHLSLEENIANTKKVAEYAHKKGVVVEAEIGRIRGRGFDKNADFLAQVDDVKQLAEQSNADIIAVGVGTAHGFYEGTPEINFERLEDIYKAVKTPLVLHGGTGISAEDLRKTLDYGIVKINVGTAFHTAYMQGLGEFIKEDGISAYPPVTVSKAMEKVTELATEYAKMMAK